MCHVDSNNSLNMESVTDNADKVETDDKGIPKKLSLDSSKQNFNSGSGTPLYSEGAKLLNNENGEYITFKACASGDSGIGSREDTDNVTDGKTPAVDVTKDVVGNSTLENPQNGILAHVEVHGSTDGNDVKSGVTVSQGIGKAVTSPPVANRPLSPIVHVQNPRTDSSRNKTNHTSNTIIDVKQVKQTTEDKTIDLKLSNKSDSKTHTEEKSVNNIKDNINSPKYVKKAIPNVHKKQTVEAGSSKYGEQRPMKSTHVRTQLSRNRYKLKSDGTSDDSSVEIENDQWKKGSPKGEFDLCDIHISAKKGHHIAKSSISSESNSDCKDANANCHDSKDRHNNSFEKYPGLRHSFYSKTHPTYDSKEGSVKQSKHSKTRRKSASPKTRSVKDSSKSSIESRPDKCNTCSGGEGSDLSRSDSITFQESLV